MTTTDVAGGVSTGSGPWALVTLLAGGPTLKLVSIQVGLCYTFHPFDETAYMTIYFTALLGAT